jgi:hypothetical protein
MTATLLAAGRVNLDSITALGIAVGTVSHMALLSMRSAKEAGVLADQNWRHWCERVMGQISEQLSQAMGKRVTFRITEPE